MDKGPKYTPEIRRRARLGAGALGLAALLAAGIFYVTNERDPYPERSGEFSKTPTWSQEFADMDTTRIDTTIWRYELSPEVPGYNNESQAYTDWAENVRIEPGKGLVLEAHRRTYQYPNDLGGQTFEYTSGRIDTINSFSFEYGKIEASMKLPEGEGVWPAFWLIPANEVHTLGEDFTNEERDSERFYMRNGEIDIMEYYGNNPEVVEATVHTYAVSKGGEVLVKDAPDEYHTYGVELAPNSITWTLDGEPYHYFEKPADNPEQWPFGDNNHFAVTLNLAMGGPAGPIEAEQDSWRFEIENVRFYAYTGSE